MTQSSNQQQSDENGIDLGPNGMGTRGSTLSRLILETADEGFCLFSGKAGRVLAFNTPFVSMFHLDADWLSGHPTVEELAVLMYQREKPGQTDQDTYVQKVLTRHQQPGERELELHLRDDHIIIGRTSAAPSGERLYTFRDVTLERRALHEIEAERKRLLGLLQHAPVSYYVIDCGTGCIIEISRSINNLTGLSEDAFVGRRHEQDDQIHPEDQAYAAEKIRHAVAARESYDIQYRRYHRNDTVRWFRDMAEPIPNPIGSTDRDSCQLAGVMIDITREKSTQWKLKESEKRFRELIEGMSDLIFYEHDTDRILTYVSPSSRQVLGFIPNELIGRRFGEITQGDDRQGMTTALRAVQEAIETRSRQPQYVIQMRSKDGRKVTMEVMEYPVVVRERVVGFRGVARDVSLVRKLERRLQERERLAILGTFSGGLAHDLNNLLLPIRASLDTLDRDPDPEMVRSRAAAIRRATDHLAELTTKLLVWTRHESSSGTSAASGSSVGDIQQWAEEAITFFRESIRDEDRQTDIRLQLEVGDPPQTAQIDPSLLNQALLNLVLNARDAMPTGGTIRLNVDRSPDQWMGRTEALARSIDDRATPTTEPHEATENQPAVRFIVTDEGCGMDKDVQSRAFNPFFSTKPRGKSTGLGLALVRSIAETVGGRVRIRSQLGEGTSIILDIPAADEGEPIEETALQKQGDATSSSTDSMTGEALIGLSDPFKAAFVKNGLAKSGLSGRVSPTDQPEHNDVIWIIDPDRHEPDEVRQMMNNRPDLTIMCVGKHDPSVHWPGGILWLDEPLDATAIQQALSRTMSAE